MNHTLELRTNPPNVMASTDTITVHTNYGTYDFSGAQLKIAQTLLAANDNRMGETLRDIRSLNDWTLAHAVALVNAAKVVRITFNF